MSTVRVLKLGGSLLSVPDWPQRFQNWLSAHPAPLNLLVVGGGEIVESVRRLDAQHDFSASFSHWLCIDLLSATARIAAQLLPAFPLIATSEELFQIARQQRRVESTTIGSRTCANAESENGATFLVDVSSYYSRPTRQRTAAVSSQSAVTSTTTDSSSTPSAPDSLAVEKAPEVCPLPESWDTTSDSLAAWLTQIVGAQELVLFKSMAPAREHKTPQAWVEQGIVDAAFADTLPEGVSVQIVNLLLVSR